MIKRTVTRGERFWCAVRDKGKMFVVRIEINKSHVPATEALRGTSVELTSVSRAAYWVIPRRDAFTHREDAERWAVMRALGAE